MSHGRLRLQRGPMTSLFPKKKKKLLAVSVATQSRTGRHFIPSPPGTRFQKCAVLVSPASCKRKNETIENLTIFSETRLCANGAKIKVPFSSFLPLFTGLLYPSVNHLFLFICIWTLLYCQSCCSSAFSVLSQ